MAFLAKRKSERRRFREGVAIKGKHGLEYVSAEDLSSEGILISSETAFDEGEQVILDFNLRTPDKKRLPIVARGEVLRVKSISPKEYLCAVRFVQISSAAMQHLRSFVDATA